MPPLDCALPANTEPAGPGSPAPRPAGQVSTGRPVIRVRLKSGPLDVRCSCRTEHLRTPWIAVFGWLFAEFAVPYCRNRYTNRPPPPYADRHRTRPPPHSGPGRQTSGQDSLVSSSSSDTGLQVTGPAQAPGQARRCRQTARSGQGRQVRYGLVRSRSGWSGQVRNLNRLVRPVSFASSSSSSVRLCCRRARVRSGQARRRRQGRQAPSLPAPDFTRDAAQAVVTGQPPPALPARRPSRQPPAPGSGSSGLSVLRRRRFVSTSGTTSSSSTSPSDTDRRTSSVPITAHRFPMPRLPGRRPPGPVASWGWLVSWLLFSLLGSAATTSQVIVSCARPTALTGQAPPGTGCRRQTGQVIKPGCQTSCQAQVAAPAAAAGFGLGFVASSSGPVSRHSQGARPGPDGSP